MYYERMESSFSNVSALTMTLMPFILFTGFIVGLILWQHHLNKKARAILNGFASLHGLDVLPPAHTYTGLLPGKMREIVGGVDDSTHRSAWFFYLPYVVRQGKSRRVYRRTVVEMSIKPTKQHIFVNSKLNDMTEQMPSAKYVRYQAEGHFSKYFDIYTPAGKQVDALSLFAPDLMAHLMAEFGQYDIEILDDKLFVYEYSKLNTQVGMEAFYTKVQALATEIDSNAPRKLTLMLASGKPDISAVTTMKRGFSPRSIIIIIVIVGVQLLSFTAGISNNTKYSPYLGFAMLGLAFIGCISAVIFIVSRRRLSKQYQVDRQQFLEGIRQSNS